MSNPLKPFPPQVECIDAMVTALRTHGFVVNKSCTGTGKTLTTIETARILGLKPLVVCPAIVVTQWKRAMEAQGVVDAGVYSWEKIRRLPRMHRVPDRRWEWIPRPVPFPL